MDISFCCGGDHPEVSSFGGQLAAVDEVGNHLANVLHIQHQPTSKTDPQKLLNKCVSLPCPVCNQDASSEPDQPSYSAYTRSLSLPSALNLVSAMKGGREKHGLSQRKLSVSWAADVYDPMPTSMSHTVNGSRGGGGGGRKQYKSKNSRKNGKKGQKGSSSSRGRDGKKHSHRKASASSSNCYNRSMDALVTLTGPPDREFDDLTVNSPDSSTSSSPTSYCGTSFLKKSLSSMHYPVAEAL